MSCSICTHPQRYQIENAILQISKENPEFTVEKIAQDYDVSVTDLRVHALMHTPIAISSEQENQVPSLARQIKLREADALNAVINEYLVTLKAIGNGIKELASSDPAGATLARTLTKPVADTYINLGGEIRQSVKALAELNQALNGKPDGSLSSLEALVLALHGKDSHD